MEMEVESGRVGGWRVVGEREIRDAVSSGMRAVWGLG